MMSRLFTKSNSFSFFILSAFSIGLYSYIGYGIQRHEHLTLGLCFLGLFTGYYLLLKHNFKTSYVISLGLISRIIFLCATPTLSQDFYRFLWDGRLIIEGINPFLWTPNEIIGLNKIEGASMEKLWGGMSALSQSNYSNYPPLHQLPALIAGLLFKQSMTLSVLFLRGTIIFADIGILIVGQKLLKLLQLQPKSIFLYFLNPLVIVELSGNLHHEGLMIFLLVCCLYFLERKKILWAGFFMGLSVLTKLIPLFLLPLFLFKLNWRRSWLFYATIAIVIIIGFTPFFNELFVTNYSKTIGLWFSNFEFNAGIFYIAKAYCDSYYGVNLILYMRYIVPIVLSLFLIYFLSKKETSTQKILSQTLLLLTVYFLISTTVHPWYIITLVFLSILTQYSYPILWSFTIIFSYFSYHNGYVLENDYWRFTQYGMVLIIFFYEIIAQKKIKSSSTD
jgi:alpha-1,6-mannosyltransferase